MSNYILNSTPLATFGFEAGQHSPASNLAIAGAWDMPARLYDIGYDWGDEKGLEPWVAQDDIIFGGRNITLVGVIKGLDRKDGQSRLYDLYAYLDTLSGLVTLTSSDFGSWKVYVNGQIDGTYISNGWYSVKIPLRQPIVAIPDGPIGVPETFDLADNSGDDVLSSMSDQITLSAFMWDGFGIDGYSFKDLGLVVLAANGRTDRPEPKAFEVTAYAHEGWSIRPTSSRKVTLRCLIMQPSYSEFVKVTNGLFKLLAQPGLRNITLHNDILRTFFVTDGFRVTGVRRYHEGRVYGFLEVEFNEVGFYDDDEWGTLTNNAGTDILASFGNIITTI